MQGDQIVTVNGQDLTTCTQEFAAKVLKVGENDVFALFHKIRGVLI